MATKPTDATNRLTSRLAAMRGFWDITAPPVTCPFLGLVHRMVHPRFAGVDQQVTGGAVHSREAGMNANVTGLAPRKDNE